MEQFFCMASIFSDSMVLQRGESATIFGRGEEGADVEVRLSCLEEPVHAVVRDGRWAVSLPPLQAAEGLTMTAMSRGQTLTVHNVAVGEVWIAGGQSNMEFWLRNEAEQDTVIPNANDSLLRFFDMPRISYEEQQKDISFLKYGVWRTFTPEHAGWFSAVGAYFGMKLRQALNVPVAIIGCNCGATSASCWLSEDHLNAVPALRVYRENYERTLETLDMEQYAKDFRERQALGQTQTMIEFDRKMARGEIPAGDLKGIWERFSKKLTPHQWRLFMLPCGPMAPTRPFGMYASMVKQLAPYTAKGVIWYQGESDVVLAEHYAELFGQVVRCWRDTWGRELPFLTVQLAPFGKWLDNTGELFPAVRRQQEKAAAEIPGVWMASIMDAGMEWDIHPKRKRPVGERLALLARGKVYGEQELLCDAPAYRWGERTADGATLHFANAGNGLEARGAFPAEIDVLANGEPIAFKASAAGDAVTITVCEPHKTALVIQYAWRPYVQAGLYNSAGLCALPFEATLSEC